MRRAGCLFGALLFLGAIGANTVVSMLFRGRPLGLASIAVLAAATLAVLLAVFLGTMRRVGLPLGDIVAAADRVASGDYSTRVAERGPPWIRSVARAFNGMTGRLQTQDLQRRHLMAEIAHELRTPLTVIQGRLEGLLDGVYPRDDRRLGEVLEETRLLARLVEDLRTLANAESGTLALQKEPTDPGILVQDVVDSFAAEAEAGQVALRLGGAADLPLIEVDPLRIREVLSNLLSNALRHTAPGGTVTLTAEALDARLVLSVADTGAGIAPEELPRIFDRFYKGRASRGSGLGLTIARNLVLAHGGEIAAESEVGRGTTIRFTLPVGTAA